MKRLILALTAVAGAGCGGGGEIPPPYSDYKVQQDIKYPALISPDLKGRKFEICEVAQGIVRREIQAFTGAKFPDCIYDQSQVQDVGTHLNGEDAHYSIASWVEFAGVRRAYSGDALILEDEDGSPHALRITRLDIGKDGSK